MGKILNRNKFKAQRSGVFAQGVYQGAHHRATSGESGEVRTETTKETSVLICVSASDSAYPRLKGEPVCHRAGRYLHTLASSNDMPERKRLTLVAALILKQVARSLDDAAEMFYPPSSVFLGVVWRKGK